MKPILARTGLITLPFAGVGAFQALPDLPLDGWTVLLGLCAFFGLFALWSSLFQFADL